MAMFRVEPIGFEHEGHDPQVVSFSKEPEHTCVRRSTAIATKKQPTISILQCQAPGKGNLGTEMATYTSKI